MSEIKTIDWTYGEKDPILFLSFADVWISTCKEKREKPMILPPSNPIAAVTHPDPYPYYADLMANKPIYRDETAGLWIASSVATVTAVLASDLCRVRPPTEQVPKALLGSPAADIFRQLVRMNDGQGHDSVKRAVSLALHTIDATQVATQSRAWARELIDEIALAANPARLADFTFHLPVYVIASLLGIPSEHLPQTALWMSHFAWCLAPASSPEQLAQGKVAAGHLRELFHTHLGTQETEQHAGLLNSLAREVRLVGCADRDVVVANGIGLLWQAYEATAGLIGNTLLALARQQDMRTQVQAHPTLLRSLIQEVLRYDPPIQNTRRYLSGAGVVAGEEMQEGDIVLVVLAAANRDPAANLDPARFDLFRQERRLFTFGLGFHACPGELLAATIARAGVEQLMLSGVNMQQLLETVQYRASANTRVPLFTGGER
jgi:cytochrome P450